MSGKIESCLIIGAGMSGLLAARELRRAGMRVTVLDKGRGVGGRLATRRIEEGVCDHGAQFFTVRSPRFAAIVEELLADGVVVEWARGFAGEDGAGIVDGHPRYRGVDGMNGIAKYLALGTDVHSSRKVTLLEVFDGQWRAQTETGEVFTAQGLILTAPVPQSLALLDSGNATIPSIIRERLEAIVYDPCLALMALTGSRTAIPDPGGVKLESGPISWIADNSQKGISTLAPSITIHASPDFSRTHWDTPRDQVIDLLLREAAARIQTTVQSCQLHRWRYSQPVEVYPDACLSIAGDVPLILAGDAFGGPRIEGAALSGLAAAAHLLSAG